MKVFFVTGNSDKFNEVKNLLAGGIELDQKYIEADEVRADTNEEVVKKTSSLIAKQVIGAFIVEDSGLFIEALNGFPGTCTAHTHKRIGNKGLLKLMKGIKDRTCWYKCAFALHDGSGMHIFSGQEKGKIALDVIGSNGWGQDPIFIPQGQSQTYGQSKQSANRFRQKAVAKLNRHLIYKKNEKI